MSISVDRVNATAVAVEITDDLLRLVLADAREVSAPLAWFPRLRDASQAARADWRLIGNGQGIHWPQLDEDVSVASLMRLK